ncbi:MAG: NUDIX hydrolase [Actinobacteria bacterium]|nr:NUDIX hydrolase [Actinomycetota bacterium]
MQAFTYLPSRVRRRVLRLVSPTYTVGALCLVEHEDGRILLVRHSYRPGWGLPGGIVKRREEMDVAARREVREEVGIEVDLLGRPFVVVEPVQQRVDVIFSARPAPGQDLHALDLGSPEIEELRWIPLDEINALHLRDELQTEAVGALHARSLLIETESRSTGTS